VIINFGDKEEKRKMEIEMERTGLVLLNLFSSLYISQFSEYLEKRCTSD